MSKKIVVLGGGAGGLVVANKLRKALSPDNEIILIDKEKNHIFYPSLLWLMIGWRNNEQIQKPLSLLEKKGINFINAEVSRIDYNEKTVYTSQSDISYDYLVIALGAELFPNRLEGFPESACNIYDLEGALKTKNILENFDGKRIVVLVSSKPFKCPAAPHEAALLIYEYFKKKQKEVEIEVVTPNPLPMGVAGPEVGNMVVSLLQSRGIRFTPQHQALKINPAKKKITFQNEKTIFYDLLIGIPPHGLPLPLKDSSVLGEDGWVKADPKTFKTDIENVYAVGDVVKIMLSVGKPLPKAGVFAHFQADVVAHNIANKINGGSAEKEFNGKGYCFLELGNGSAGYASGNFYAEPEPAVNMKKPSKMWHFGKILFEKWWLWRWF